MDYIAVVQMDVINHEPNFIVCSIKVVDFVDKIDYSNTKVPTYVYLTKRFKRHSPKSTKNECFIVR